ncbi:hypothetical protein C8R42DRAFT_648367 [Lentinula raphanica]|nr:hypothetical protein C8R42DRAFT_648367 [Lentinula raphanica]
MNWFSAGTPWARLAAAGLAARLRGRTTPSLVISALANVLRRLSNPVKLNHYFDLYHFQASSLLERDPEVWVEMECFSSESSGDTFSIHQMSFKILGESLSVKLSLSPCSEDKTKIVNDQNYISLFAENVTATDEDLLVIHSTFSYSLSKKKEPKKLVFSTKSQSQREKWTQKQRVQVSKGTVPSTIAQFSVGMTERFYSEGPYQGCLTNNQKWLSLPRKLIEGTKSLRQGEKLWKKLLIKWFKRHPDLFEKIETSIGVFPLQDINPVKSLISSFVINFNVVTAAHKDKGDENKSVVLFQKDGNGWDKNLFFS